MQNCQKNYIARGAEEIMQEIRQIRSRVSTLEALLKEKKGVRAFTNFLKEDKSDVLLRCWINILQFEHGSNDDQAKMLTNDDEEEKEELQGTSSNGNNGQLLDSDILDKTTKPTVLQQAQMIFDEFISEKSKNQIWQCKKFVDNISENQKEKLLDDIQTGLSKHQNDDISLRAVYSQLSKQLYQQLKDRFEHEFKKSDMFFQLQKKLDAKDRFFPLSPVRKIVPFPENSNLVLVVTNPDMTHKEIKLSNKKSIATIGRDCANTVVLDDPHVSRSHARIKYNSTEAHFTDLGSHHGSLLNGAKVLQEKLQDKDRLKIGGCEIVFEVRPKVGFMSSFFGRK
ncbi:FHA domain-containing protein [Reticulomyxa filosa]|uniref:FHA domain-containing protein n=1 Tax=Reticulomyxa filosa TaxID=46433 RepID=X6P7N0_RETFI|nr:FHA domain-containing protein [Reticulomyxa filosa]|eukprot:ETO34525.1 FHA domain-containing protein [Reticulomyxa filosa]